VETRISCRQVGLPRIWTATFAGTTTWRPAPAEHEETTTWEMTATLELTQEYKGVLSYRDVAGSGSYSVDGFDGACTITASGTIDSGEMSLGLRIDPAAGTLDWDWQGVYKADSTRTCPDGAWPGITPIDAKEMVRGLDYDPDGSGTVTGHRVVEASNSLTHDYTWTITPAE
jgi:hypothetical protein